MPHGVAELTNASRLRAAAGFVRPLLCHVAAPQTGKLPTSKSFITVAPNTLLLSAVRKTETGTELRILENEGQTADASVELRLPVKEAVETDLLGRNLRVVSNHNGRLAFRNEPWKFRTFKLT
jgi:hypothetical protein